MSLVCETTGSGDLAEAFITFQHQPTRTLQALAHDIGMWRLPRADLESPTEMALAEPNMGREFLDIERLIHALIDDGIDPHQLPRGQSTRSAGFRTDNGVFGPGIAVNRPDRKLAKEMVEPSKVFAGPNNIGAKRRIDLSQEPDRDRAQIVRRR